MHIQWTHLKQQFRQLKNCNLFLSFAKSSHGPEKPGLIWPAGRTFDTPALRYQHSFCRDTIHCLLISRCQSLYAANEIQTKYGAMAQHYKKHHDVHSMRHTWLAEIIDTVTSVLVKAIMVIFSFQQELSCFAETALACRTDSGCKLSRGGNKPREEHGES